MIRGMKYTFLFIFTLIFLSGCTIDNQESESPSSMLKSINNSIVESVEISQYRSDSRKVQPELIMVAFEQQDLDLIDNWISKIEGEPTKDRMIAESIYYLKLFYNDTNKTKTQLNIVYAVNSKGDVFIHFVPNKSARDLFNYESFKDEDLKIILEKLSDEYWFKAEKLDLINPSK